MAPRGTGPLARFVAGRILHAALLLWGVATLIFALVELAPGDVADRLVAPDTAPEVRALTLHRLGLDRPLHVRYLAMLAGLLRGDLGTSLTSDRPVIAVLADALPATLLLSTVTLLALWPAGVGLGIFQALRRDRPSALVAGVLAMLLWSVPEFWLALLLQRAAGTVGLPTSGLHDAVTWDHAGASARTLDVLRHVLLPGVAMGLASAGGVARHVRAALLEVLDADFVRAAHAKGLPGRVVIVRHALRNALPPVITLAGLSLPGLVGGSVLVEAVFGWPGTGRLLVDAVLRQDTPVVVGGFLLLSTLVALGNLVADVLVAVADPRVRLA